MGESNKLRVAKDSNEYIGGDKDSNIQGNYIESIQGDSSKSVSGNKGEIIEGNKQEHIESNFDIISQSQGTISAQKGLYTHSQTLSFQAQDTAGIESDSIYMNAQSDIIHTTNNQITHQVGETYFGIKGDSVTIKAGGVEVVIDSNGLMVKGGEVKSE